MRPALCLSDAIADRQNLVVNDSEYHEVIERQAKEFGYPVEKLLEVFRTGEGEDNVRHSLLSRKIRDYLLKNNQIHYDMVSEAELTKVEAEQ